MSDEIRANISAMAKALCYYPSGPSNVNSCCPGIGRCEMDAAIAEITHLRAELDTARREGMEQAAQWHDQQAAEAQKFADMKVSALDAKVWGDCAANHREYAAAIRAAAKDRQP